MNVSVNIKEWASVGAGAMLSGALAVVFLQMAVVHKGKAKTELEAAGQAARDSAALEMQQQEQSGTRDRLLLPRKMVAEVPTRGDDSLVTPEAIIHDQQLVQQPIVQQPQTQVQPGTLVERLESGVAKSATSTLKRMANAMQRSDGSGIKASQAEVRPRLATALDGHTTEPARRSGPVTSINPTLRDQNQTVNAAFDDLDIRTPGEELSWEVHDVFQNVDGPRPFFYVDEYTGTLMFGLGWQH